MKSIRFTNAESTRLGELPFLAFPDSSAAKEVNDFIREAKHQVELHLPARIRKELADWRADPYHESVLVVEGCPIDPELPPTPFDGLRSKDKLTSISESILVGNRSVTR